MSAHVVHLGRPGHEPIQALLPWYLTGALDESEAEQVRAHLAECACCRAELDAERALVREYAALDGSRDVQAGLAAMHARIAGQAARQVSEPGAARRWRARDWLHGGAWLGWVLAAQFGVIAALSLLVVMGPVQSQYPRALGETGPAMGANALVMFSPDTTEAEIRGALQASGARLVGGPTATAAYLVRLASGDLPEAIARLRAQRGVVLAESLSDEGRP